MSDAAVQPQEMNYPAGDPRWLDGIPKQKLRIGDAFRSFKKLTQDVEETKYVFEIIGALTGSSFTNLYRRFLKTEHGQKVIKEDIKLLDILTRREWLRSLPEGTLGRTYIDFLDFEGLSPEGLMQAQQEGLEDRQERFLEIGDPGIQTFADRMRDSHDLWHIVVRLWP